MKPNDSGWQKLEKQILVFSVTLSQVGFYCN